MNNDSLEDLNHLITCFICYGDIKDAHCCNKCSKIACKNCYIRWLSTNPSCPHCKVNLSINELVNCRFMNDVYTTINTLQDKLADKNEFCHIHQDNPMRYYCIDCSISLCSDCLILGSNQSNNDDETNNHILHTNHEIIKVNDLYEKHIYKLKLAIKNIESKLTLLNKFEYDINDNLHKVESAKHIKTLEIQNYLMKIEKNLESQLKHKLLKLLSQKNEILKSKHLLETIVNELYFHMDINKVNKNELIKRLPELDDILLQVLHDDNPNQHIMPCNINHIDTNFDIDLKPKFNLFDYYIPLLQKNHIYYSNSNEIYGIKFRLKVYLNKAYNENVTEEQHEHVDLEEQQHENVDLEEHEEERQEQQYVAIFLQLYQCNYLLNYDFCLNIECIYYFTSIWYE